MTTRHCTGCNRILITRVAWNKFTTEQRTHLHKTHARHEATGKCNVCYKHEGLTKLEPEDIYTGGWVRDGLVWRPVKADRDAA